MAQEMFPAASMSNLFHRRMRSSLESPCFARARRVLRSCYAGCVDVTISLRGGCGVRQCVQTRDRAQVLLAVAAAQHLVREDGVQWHARGEDRELSVVHTVHEGHEAQRLGLVGE